MHRKFMRHTCMQCGAEFSTLFASAKYCCKRCKIIHSGGNVMGNGRITKICIICHNSFVAAHKDTLYCSQKCKLKQYDINKGINQNKVEWLDLRERILERDNYTCQKCGYFSMTTGMEVHHVKMLSRGGENKPNNMITLCGKCHSHAHNIPAD